MRPSLSQAFRHPYMFYMFYMFYTAKAIYCQAPPRMFTNGK